MAEDRIQIEIAPDGLEARLQIEPGPALERDALASALEAAGIHFGIDARVLLECENRIADEKFALAGEVIARGKAPITGCEGRLELDFRPGPLAFVERSDGSCDWLDRGTLTQVTVGDALGTVHPPTDGTKGMRVDGDEIDATPGKPCAVAFGDGIELREDGRLYALRDGAIQIRPGSQLDVLDHYDHKGDVDIRSGHLQSRGSVSIGGNVCANFEVRAVGDVAIKGSVFGGRVIATGNLQIGRGISGGEDGFAEAGGDLGVHHAQASRLCSGGSLAVATDCVGTQVRARQLRVGKRLHGGEAVVETLIHAQEAGSASGAGTYLRVGEPFELPREVAKREAMAHRERRMISRSRAGATSEPRSRTKVGRAARETVAIDRELMKRQQQRCNQRAELLKVAQIDVIGTVNPGVRIRFGSRRFDVDEPLQATRFTLEQGEDHDYEARPMNFEDLTARDLMSTKLETCDSESSAMEALKRMDELGIHCLLVRAPAPGRSLGIISVKDIVQLLGDAGPLILDEIVVSEVMTSPVVSLPEYLKIPDCVNLMRMTGVRSAPVMQGKELVGILSFSDVVKWIARNA